MDSILNSIKKLLGSTEEYTHFDPDITMHINSILSFLTQMGVGPAEGFSIEDSSSTWSEFIPPTDKRFLSVKSYVYMKVKMIFDPPLNAAVLEALKASINEFEWRLSVAADQVKESEGVV